jgi:hypothetical protein
MQEITVVIKLIILLLIFISIFGKPWRKWEDDNKSRAFKKWDGKEWTQLFWLRIRTGGGRL